MADGGGVGDGDFETKYWRPQGIAVIPTDAASYVAVSWYGTEGIWPLPAWDREYKGVRIAFVDTADWDDIRYRFVLLVDRNGKTFEGMHAGGLVYLDGKLHVPDTRSSLGGKTIHVFPIDQIEEVPLVDRDEDNSANFFRYRYILRPNDDLTYQVPIKPSFLSYDPDLYGGRMLTGSFCNSSCSEEERSLLWYAYGEDGPDPNPVPDTPCDPFTYDMQGAASYSLSQGATLISTSYGRGNPSTLYILDDDYSGCEGQSGFGTSTPRTVEFPDGLEDLHYEKSSGNIWMLNEFKDKRYVWAVHGSNYDTGGVPTLNEWGTIAFSILLAGSGLWVIRRRKRQALS